MVPPHRFERWARAFEYAGPARAPMRYERLAGPTFAHAHRRCVGGSDLELLPTNLHDTHPARTMNDGSPPAPQPLWGTPFVFAGLVFVLTAAGTWGVLQIVRARPPAAQDVGQEVVRDPLEDQLPREVGPKSALTLAEQQRVDVFARAARSVVHIRARRIGGLSSDDGPGVPSRDPTHVAPGTGTGIVWSERGYIVTNAHLIDGRDEVVVTLVDGTEWRADYVGTQPNVDLAVLTIGAPRSLLRVAQLGTSADLRVGQDVLAIGNPFGLDHTLSTGVVSGLGRRVLSYGRVLEDLIQTDTAINPGNSGGPLLNSAGQAVGITTAIHSAGLDTPVNIGIGFAIPIDVVNEVIPTLIAEGIEPWYELGLYLAPDWQNKGMVGSFGARGILVLDLVGGGPAQQAGIRALEPLAGFFRVHNVIVGVEGEPVPDRETFDRLIHARRGNPTLGLDVLRRDVDLIVSPRVQGGWETTVRRLGGPGSVVRVELTPRW